MEGKFELLREVSAPCKEEEKEIRDEDSLACGTICKHDIICIINIPMGIHTPLYTAHAAGTSRGTNSFNLVTKSE